MRKWIAQWIWLPKQPEMDNLYVHAHKVVKLEQVPPKATIDITASSLYKLYVNGVFVGRGPNPADPTFYYYDTYDVTSLLHGGENVLAVTSYNYGPNNQSITHQNYGDGGLLVELHAGELVVGTDASWRVIQASEYDQKAELNNTLFGDYKEICDTTKAPDGWQMVGFDDSQWYEPRVLDQPPCTNLHEREIPTLGGKRCFPVAVTQESASVAYAWRDDWEFYHEQSLVPGSDGKPMEALKTHPDFSPSVLLNFGHLVTGYPEISILSSGGGMIDVLYGESINTVRVDRFVLNGKPQILQPYNRRTFRYMRLLFVDTPEKVFIDRVSCDMNTFPVEYRGSFSCSDDRLNQIYEVGRLTIHLSMLDHFVDCPWRERTIYGGDLYVENLLAMYCFGDPRLNHKTLRQLFAIQFEEGAIPPLGPYGGYRPFYPSWTAFAALALLDDYQLTGDRAFLDESWPHLSRVLDWTIDQIEHTDPHLIGEPAEGDDIAAWSAHGQKKSFGAWGNLPFYLLLKRTSTLAASLGFAEDSSRCHQAAGLMEDAVRRLQVDERGLFRMYPPEATPDQSPMFSNSLLVWSGVLEDSTQTLDGMVGGVDMSPFHAFFTGDALFSHERTQHALDYLRMYFGGMIELGATTFWEHYTPGEVPSRGVSLCHGWSAAPAYLLPAYVLGVRPLEPGFAKALIAPQVGDLAWASGVVPTPQGDIKVRWECDGRDVRLDLDTPVPARVELQNEVRELSAGQHEVRAA